MTTALTSRRGQGVDSSEPHTNSRNDGRTDKNGSNAIVTRHVPPQTLVNGYWNQDDNTINRARQIHELWTLVREERDMGVQILREEREAAAQLLQEEQESHKRILLAMIGASREGGTSGRRPDTKEDHHD